MVCCMMTSRFVLKLSIMRAAIGALLGILGRVQNSTEVRGFFLDKCTANKSLSDNLEQGIDERTLNMCC